MLGNGLVIELLCQYFMDIFFAQQPELDGRFTKAYTFALLQLNDADDFIFSELLGRNEGLPHAVGQVGRLPGGIPRFFRQHAGGFRVGEHAVRSRVIQLVERRLKKR